MKTFSEWMEQRELQRVPIRRGADGRPKLFTRYKMVHWDPRVGSDEADPRVMKRLCTKRGLSGRLRDKCDKLGLLPKKVGIDFGSPTDFTGDAPSRTVMGHEVPDSKPADWDSESWEKFNNQVNRWNSHSR
jgi:hypothetical protein